MHALVLQYTIFHQQIVYKRLNKYNYVYRVELTVHYYSYNSLHGFLDRILLDKWFFVMAPPYTCENIIASQIRAYTPMVYVFTWEEPL